MPRAIFTLLERLIESQPADHTCHTPIQPIKAQLQLSLVTITVNKAYRHDLGA
jgi:hypothetical protein